MRISQSFTQRFVALSFVLSFVIAGVAQAQQASSKLDAQQLPSGPRIWLQDNHSLTVEHIPAAFTDAATAANQPVSKFGSISQSQPVAMVSGDLNQDGIDDLAVGYKSGTGGFVSILKGNLDAFAPQSEESFNAIARSEFPAPFLSQAKSYAVPVSPDFMAIGNFAGNGRQDLIIAAKGGTHLYLLAGDGKGNFATPKPISLDGTVNSLAAGKFGRSTLPTLLVGLNGSTSTLALFASTSNGFARINELPLAGEASSISFGRLYVGSSDAAFVAGGQVLILHAATAKHGIMLETLSLPLTAKAITLGNFIFDRYPGAQIAVLASDGSVQFAVHGQFDPRLYTAEEQKLVRQASRQGKPNPLLQPVTDFEWKVVEVQTHFASDQALNAPVFFRARVTNHGPDDVVLLNAAPGRYAILSHENAAPDAATFKQAELSLRGYQGTPIAALPMRLNVDGRPGIVALHSGEVAPSAIMPIPDPTFNVNTTADGVYPGACAAARVNQCTLREAILELSPSGDTIMIPKGTYYLTIGRQTPVAPATQDYSGLTGALYVNNPATIVGTSQAGTIIKWGSPSSGTVDTVMAINEDLDPVFTNSTASISNLTIQNGVNNGTYFGLDGDGGGMMFDTGINGTDTLTMTNVTVQNNKTLDGDGGGVALFNTNNGNGTATLSNCTISGNSTVVLSSGDAGVGGGIFVGYPSSLILKNSTISNNLADETVSAPGVLGQGGGIDFTGSSTESSSISGSTITGNTASGFGGGIYSTQQFTISGGSAITNNTAAQDGGGIWYNGLGNYTSSILDSTITGNKATAGSGGGILISGDPTYNALTMNYNRLAGNTAGKAGSNLSVDSHVTGTINATENWWGTNEPATTIDNPGATKATYTPYLVLTHTSNPQSIAVNGTATLTAAIDSDSAGTAISSANLTAIDGVGVTFNNPSLGNLSAAQPSLNTNGQATATFTATTAESFPSSPFGTADATVDAAVVPVNSNLVAAASETGTTATITTVGANGFTAAEQFIASGITPSGYNTPSDTFSTVTSATGTQLTYTDGTTGLTAGSGGTVNAGIQITVPPVPPTIAISFNPAVVMPSQISTLTYTITNNMASAIDASFTDAIPDISILGIVGNTCGGSALADTSTISYSNASLAASVTCTIIVKLISFDDRIYNNSVTIDSVAAGNGNTANATLTVVNPPSITKSFGAASIPVSATTSLTFTINNPNNNTPLTGVNFNDSFPAGLVVATPANLNTTNCRGSASASDGSSTVTLTGDSLHYGESCQVIVSVTGTAVTSLTNSVTVNDTTAGNGNTGSATLNVTAANTTTAVTSSSNPSVYGQSVTFTATVSPISPATGTPTGTVTFLDGGNPITGCGSVSLNSSGVATCTTTTLPVGSNNLTAAYNGSGNFNISSGGLSNNPQVVNQASTTTGVTSSANPSVYGQSVTFTATVAPVSPGAGTLTGTVSFFNGASLIGSGTVSAGVATFTTSALPVGNLTITATYNGDGNFNGSLGSLNTNPQVVTLGSDTTTVTSSLNPSVYGQSVTFTATVSPTAPATGTPTGTVNFFDGGNSIGTGTLNGSGVATFTTSALAGGSHTITTSYTGDSNFNGSTGSLTGNPQVVNAASTSTTVTQSQSAITLGDTVTFTATVTSSAGSATGVVTFFDGITPLGTGTLIPAGGNAQATFSTALLSAVASPHSISATYQGAGGFLSSTSTQILETVNTRTSTTGLVLNPKTVVAGQSSTATVTLTDAGSSVPPGTPDIFATTGAPATGRTGFSATLIADGTLLVAGGTDSTATILQSAEIYSVSGASFSATGNLNTARTGAVAVLLPTGNLLVAGGSSDGTANGALNSAELYNPGTGLFTASSNTLLAARFGATATLLNNGNVLLAGGVNSGGVSNTAELYDPTTDTFTATGNLNVARTGATATLLGNGKVLIAGGSSDGTANGALNSAEIFDPAGNAGAGTFTPVAGSNPTLTTGRWQPEAALSLTGTVLIAGGANSSGALTSADIYDPAADSFTASAQQMAQARANGSAVALPNGMVLLAGGSTSQAVDLYDPESDLFDSTGNLLQSDNGLVSTLLNNGQVLVVGLTSGSTPASDAELYSPSFNPLGSINLTSSEPTDNITSACVLTPSNGTASTCNATVTPVNVATSPHTITGTYLADNVHNGSNNTGSLTVSLASTTTAVTSSLNPSSLGQSVTFTATVSPVSPGAGTPTGTVTFMDGGNTIGSGTLAGGVATFSTSTLTTGSHTITTSYGGDVNFNGSTGALTGNPQVVTQGSVTTAVTSSLNPSQVGQSVTFTATVTAVAPATTTPTGTVTFLDGGVSIGTGTLSGGVATFATSALAAGNHTITTTYSGDGNYTSSTGSMTGNPQVVVAPPVLSAVFTPSTININANSTLTITITNPPANTVALTGLGITSNLPGGINFINGGSFPTCGGTLDVTTNQLMFYGGSAPANGTCQFNLTVQGTTVGNYSVFIGKVTSGNGGFGNNTTASLAVVPIITIAPTSLTAAHVGVAYSTSLSASGGASPYNYAVTAGALPAGLTLLSNGTLSGTPTASGNFNFTVTATDAQHYTGSQAYSLSVAAPTITLTPSSLPNGLLATAYSQSLTASGGTAPYTFSVASGSLPSGLTLSPSGALTGTPTTTGTYNFTVQATDSSTGTGPFSGSASYTIIISKESSSTALTSSLNPSVYGQSVTFTATITAIAPAAGTPTGTVTFFDGGTSIGTGTLSSGVATFSTTALPTGSDSITATYNGDSNFNGSTTASPTTQTVNKANSSLGLTTTLTPTVYGESVTFTATLSAVSPGSGTPSGTVTFMDGATTIGTGTLAGGVATFTTSALSTGNHTITASYGGDGNFNSSSTATGIKQVVDKDATTSAVSSSSNPSILGQSVTFTATISAASPGAGTPTGSVTFLDGGASIGTGTLSGGVATFSTSTLVSGNHTITTSYSGDGNFVSSTGSLTGNPQVVTKGSATTAVTSSANPSVIGQAVTFTATLAAVAPATETPTGTVTFFDGGTSIGTGTLSNKGIATFTTSSLTDGDHTITTSYGGDSNFSTSTGSLSTNPQVVNKASSTTSLHSSLNPSVYGQSVTFTATISAVAPGSGTPTGTVTFFDGTTSIGTGTLSNGVATFSTTTLPTGSDSITATYNGDSNFNGSTSSTAVAQTVNKADTSVSLNTSGTPSVYGESVTFTATLTAVSPGSGTPTGTVTFLDGGTSIGTGTLTAGVATFATSTLATGTHTITASYGGDGNFNTSSSTTGIKQVVNKASDTTTLTSSANPGILGQSVTFTAIVSAASPAIGTPTGTVTFLDGGNSIGTGTLSGGVATFTTANLATGNHTVTTSYGGDGNFMSGTGSLTGNPQVITKGSATTAVTSSTYPSVIGQAVTFTATLSAVAPATEMPTGTVTFLDGGVSIGTGKLSGGIATFTTSSLTGGNHTITTSYGGDGNFSTSAGSLTSNPQVVNKDNSSTSLTSSTNPSVYGQNVTFTATISAVAPGSGTPTGTVTFFNNGTSIGTGTLSSGVATFSTTALATGSDSITATYNGDSNFNGGTSATAVAQVVNKNNSSIGLTTSLTPTVYGQSVTFTATLSALTPGAGTPTGTVTFLDGVTAIGTGTLSAGVATFATTSLSTGNHTITASYGGDWNFNSSTATGISQSVNKDGTTSAVSSSLNPSLIGQSVTFTAAITAAAPGAGTPTGTVTFLDGGTSIGTGTLAGGVATLTTSTLVSGNHTITTSYGGDGNFISRTGSLTGNPQVVTKGSDTTTVTSSANPSLVGQAVTFTATVTAVAPATGTPTGTVTFLDGGVSIGTGTLTGGIATLPTSALAEGPHTITTSYGGDSNFSSGTGSLTGNPQVVSKASSSTALISSLNPSVYGQSVTFTATVSTVAPATGTPTGTVTFLSNGTRIGTGTLTAGVATLSTTSLAAGNENITAHYGGDSNYNSSSASAVAQVVNKDNSSVGLTASLTPTVYGESVTFTATLSAVSPGSGMPTGTVTFLDGGNSIGTGTLTSGVATFTTSALSTGNHTITASYDGDPNFNTSSTKHGLKQVVDKDTTASTVTSSANPSVLGQSVTFTATISASAPGAGTATGTVTFFDGTTSIGTGTLSGGVATYSTSTLAAGNHTITTRYGGDGNFVGSSGSLTGNPQVVTKGSATTAVTSSANPSLIGQSVTFTATLTAVSPATATPTGTVTFLDGGVSIGTGTLNNKGIATFTTASLADGNHTITTAYGGDSNFSTSAGSLTENPQVVIKGSSTLALTSSLNPSALGKSVTFTATLSSVAPATGTPTGSVTFLDGGISIGTGTLSAGIAKYSTSTLTAGNHTITASYSGDSNFKTSTGSLADNPQVVVAPPVLSAAFSPSTIIHTATGTLALTITNSPANTAALTGVSLSDSLPIGLTVTSGSATSCGGTLTTTAPTSIQLTGGTIAANGSCQINVTVTGAVEGIYTDKIGPVSSTDGGTGNTTTASLTVQPTITLSSATLPAAQVAVAYSTTLSGTGGRSPYTYAITTGALPAGLAFSTTGSITGTPTAGGIFNFTVTATDSLHFTGSQAYTLTVTAPTITITPTSLPNGQGEIAYSQTLTAAGGTAPYSYAIGSGSLPAGITLSPSGVLSGTPTAAGTFNFTVVVTDSSSGSGPYNASFSYSLFINLTTTTLSFGAIPTQTYGNAPFTATATSNSPAVITYSLISGPATISPTTGLVTLAGAGTVTIGASQPVSSGYTSATAQTTFAVQKQNSAIALSASSTSITPGQSVTFTATVTPALLGNPTGSVNFYDGSTLLGNVAVTSGTAAYTTSTLAAGETHNISATYSGDVNFNSSTNSTSIPIIVAPLDFSILISGNSFQSILPGGSITYQIVVAPLYGQYAGTVNFTAAGLPPGATATFSPSSIQANGGPQTVTITIQTASLTGAAKPQPQPGSTIPNSTGPISLAFMTIFCIGAVRMRTRKLRRFLSSLAIIAGIASGLVLSGCGAGYFTQAPQNYNITITATSGNLQHSADVTLTVQ